MQNEPMLDDDGLTAWLRWCSDEARRAFMRGESPHLETSEVTGFVEQKLPVDFRAELLEHVAACPECGVRVSKAVRERLWTVTLAVTCYGRIEGRASGSWPPPLPRDRPTYATAEELQEYADLFCTRRRQGDWNVFLTAHYGDSQRVGLGITLTSARNREPWSQLPVRLEIEQGWDYVLFEESVTDGQGRVSFLLPLGEYSVQLPTAPQLTVLISRVPPEVLEESPERWN